MKASLVQTRVPVLLGPRKLGDLQHLVNLFAPLFYRFGVLACSLFAGSGGEDI